jgi:hypothetical protein
VSEEQDDLTLVYMYGFKNGEQGMKVDIEQLHKLLDTIGEINATLTEKVMEKNDEIERLRAALEDIANERGICLTCGKLAIRGPRGAVFCDPHLFGIDQRCRWSLQNPIGLARAALEEEKADG